MKGIPLIVASFVSVTVGIGIMRGLCALLDAWDRRVEQRRRDAWVAHRVARSRAIHPSNTVRVIRTRPFDFDRDAK